MTALAAALPRVAGKPAFPGKLPLRELTEQALLQQLAPVGALVNGRATSSTFTAAPGCIWSRPPAKPA